MSPFLSEDELKHKHDEERRQLQRELDEKDNALREYRREHGKLEVLFNRVVDAIEPLKPLNSVFKEMYRRNIDISETEITPVKHITDSHMGMVQEADEIEGFNEFNPEICRNRNLGFTKSFIDWILLHRGPYNIRNCHVIFTGDLISGDIHDELRVTNAFPVTQQVIEAAQIHSMQLSLLAPYFETLIVHFITEDNHSRITKKPQAKEAGINSFGYLIGKMIEAYIKEHRNIEFNIYPMHSKVVSISTMNYLIMHGHGIRAWMGIPWYGIERRTAREATARQNIIMQDIEKAKEVGFNKIVHGHFHAPFDTSLFTCGGSVSGTDAYDHQSGRHADPCQSAWMIHPKWGEFNRTNFQLKRYDQDN